MTGFGEHRTASITQACALRQPAVSFISCMKDWLKVVNTRPTCSTFWRKVGLMKSSTLANLDPDGFEIYVQWLYSSQIPDYASETVDESVVRLLKAHIVGNAIADSDFLRAVRTKIAEIAIAARRQAGMSYAAIEFLYQTTHERCAILRSMVDFYTVTGAQESLKDHGNVSRLFLIDMAESYMQRSRPRHGDADIWGMLADEGHIKIKADADES